MAMLRYTLPAVLFCFGLYAAAVLGSLLFAHWLKLDRVVDCGSVPSDIFYNAYGQRAVVYGRNALAKIGPQVILIGASNVCESFRPGEISPLLGGLRVENFAISGGDPHTFGEVADLAYDVVPQSSWKDVTLVLGVWYGSFIRVDGVKSDAEIALENEELRFGLYKRTPKGQIQPAVRSSLLPLANIAVRPFILTVRLTSILTWLGDTMSAVLLAPENSKINPDILAKTTAKLNDKARLAELLRLRLQMAGALNCSNFRELLDVVHRISTRGSRVVVVDLPIPAWHSGNVPAFQDYQRRKLPFFRALQLIPGAHYINLQQGFADSGFYDSVHPRPQETAHWAQRLATPLRAIIATDSSNGHSP